MRTDIPLKTLTALRPADLLPLLGADDAIVLGVETLELPSGAAFLDNLLRLREPQGTVYLHLVEWQGYKDPFSLWRVMGYLAWLGPHRGERPIVVTIIYLHPEDDVGDTLVQMLAGQVRWSITFHVVRLWEQDATAAAASGRLGFAVLAPLMAGATAELVEQVATQVLEHVAPGHQQADLLTILGVFAEPVMDTSRFVRMIGREKLMASDLISYLVDGAVAERTAELEKRAAERTAELEKRATEQTVELEKRAAERLAGAVTEALVLGLRRAVTDAITVRFPTTPIASVTVISDIRDPEQLQQLHHNVLRAPDQARVEQLLHTLASISR
ncbi:MAG TPA: hypothetical protein VNL71_11495 [Chloroflexota bacterium]|nr:hypothetical protein [Chloroflexota bacterium]